MKIIKSTAFSMLSIVSLMLLLSASGNSGITTAKNMTASPALYETVAPDKLVRNLYAAHEAGAGPFFQTKNRALIDEYFSKDLADLIWKDAVNARGEVGAIDFDPLYGSQDPQISNFTVMETGWGGDSKFGPDDEAVVQVTFKDSGKERMVSFQFKQDKDKNWRIYDVHYRSDGSEVKLVEVLAQAAVKSPTANDSAPTRAGGDEVEKIRGELQVGKTESVILYFGEESGDYAAYCFANASEAGRAILAACKDKEQCEIGGDVDYEGGCKVPGLEADLSASGRVLNVESVKAPGREPSGSPSQSQGQPYTPASQTAERKAIADALRVPVEMKLKKSVVFKIDHLKVQDGWAFLRGVPQRPDGRPVDYSDTSYRRQKELGMFDDQISALLKKEDGKWVVVVYDIGATDVVYLDWAEKHKAPPAIFE
jgi:hypothetical protein